MLYRLQTLLDSPEVIIATIAVIAIAIIAWLVFRQPSKFKAFESDAGGVLVTRKAVRELAQRCCEGLGGVSSARARVSVHSGEVLVHIGLHLKRSANLKSISGYLREQIHHGLTESLGIEKIRGIEVTVDGFVDEAPQED